MSAFAGYLIANKFLNIDDFARSSKLDVSWQVSKPLAFANETVKDDHVKK